MNNKSLLSFASPKPTAEFEAPESNPDPEPAFEFSKEVSIAPSICEEDIPAPVKSIVDPEERPF